MTSSLFQRKFLRPRVARAVAFSTLALLACFVLLARGSHAGAQSDTTDTGAQGAKTAPRADFVPGEILVRFRGDDAGHGKFAAPQVMTLSTERGELPVQVERFAASDAVEGLRLARVAPEQTESAVAALNARADVLYAEPNYLRHKLRAPNDPRYAEQWALKNTAQAGNDIGAETAWNTTTGDRSIVVGVVDEGIDINHPDLAANIWHNPGEIPGNGVDDDNNGYVDDVNGYDFVHNDASVYDGPGTALDGSPIDGHGTHVAGTIGATGDNSIGVVGVNWQTSLMSLKFIGADGNGTTADLARVFAYAKLMRDRWATSGGTQGANIRVLNNSYGGPAYSRAELDLVNALAQSGILFVAAAGNGVPVPGSGDVSFNTDFAADYPAGYDAPNVISVAAMTRFNDLASFSNTGLRTVTMAAPGQDILSTLPGGAYGTLSGTSMAVPHVAGAAALVCAANPNISVGALRAALIFNGDPFNSAPTGTGRRLRVDKALAAVAEHDTTPPAFVSNLRVTAQNVRAVTLTWTAPGDDGTTGQAAFYELRYSDRPDSEQQLIAVSRPAAPGTQQSITVNLPLKHTGGLLRLKTYDNAGNSTESVVGVALTAATADPYVVTTAAPAPLSTGGSALSLRADDKIQTFVSLPFQFPFFGRSNSSVAVSTNGAIYVPIPPDFVTPLPRVGSTDGAIPTVEHLNHLTMIAGLWDDLRTDCRAGDDIYVVTPDPDRVIFRWQGLTYSPNCSAQQPVNFEIELQRNGTIIIRYGNGNQSVHPVVGLSGGSPDPYVVTTHTSETSAIDLSNAATVVFTPRNLPPPPSADLEVTSSATPAPVSTGQTLTYTVNVHNLGPSDLTGATFTAQLPPGTSFLSCSTNAVQGTCTGPASGTDGGTVNGSTGPISGFFTETIQFTIRVRVNAPPGTTLTLNASASSVRLDPNPANNAYALQTFVVNDTGLTNVRAIAAGRNSTFAIKTDNTLWAWGENLSGQFGDGSTGQYTTPVQLGLTNVASVALSNGHTLVARQDGTVWAAGYNGYGQLGDGTSGNERHTFAQVQNLAGVVAVAAGDFHSVALKADGTVWTWGASYALGANTSTNAVQPVQVAINNVTAISARDGHVLALKADGTLWAWGANDNGQLGDTTTTLRLVPVQVANLTGVARFAAAGATGSSGFSIAVKSDGTVWTWGDDFSSQLGYGNPDFTPHPNPAQVPLITGASAAAGGSGHTLALKADGTVWTWGANGAGQLGRTTNGGPSVTPTQVPNLAGITAVAAGNQHSVALKNDGTVVTWGDNGFGQLGDGSTTQRGTPVRVSGLGTVSAPVFDPDGGTFNTPFVDVRITCATPGAVIHYRTNGGTPTEFDPVVANGATVRLVNSQQFSARAFRPDMFASSIKSALFNLSGQGGGTTTLQFNQFNYDAVEGAGVANVTVTRTGDISTAVTVDYATADDPAPVRCDVIGLTAYARCDYATTTDTLRFAAGETIKTFKIPLIND
ncbi:MAG TPA: S8 family serine peptidase, partial [Pyrinomonadaceae bacterium]